MIKKFNEMNEGIKSSFYTVGDLRKFISELSDDAPVIIVNPVGKGTNEYTKDSIGIEDVKIDDKGYSYYGNTNNRTDVETVKGLVIYEG